MRIVNAMFGCRKGGIEQAFIDYSLALMREGNEVLSLAHPAAAILPQLASHAIHPVTIKNIGQWDVWAVRKLKRILHDFKPDIIITHGNRATVLLKKAAAGKIPLVGVCHNYHLKHLVGCSGLFTITKHLQETVIVGGQPAETVYVIPNMIALPEEKPIRPKWRNTPVIGAMGRFVAKKGFNVFIEALAILKQENVAFKAILGGGGEEEAALRQLAEQCGVGAELNFSGWIEDKKAFYQQCDIFCLPSLHEPFGIVLLEALLQALPVVTTASEGPREIVEHEKDALMVPVNDAVALAAALRQLLTNPVFAEGIGQQGNTTVTANYDSAVIGKQLQQAINRLLLLFRERKNS